MKRLLLSVAFAFLATAALAAGVDRDVLITGSGAVYSVASQPSKDGDSSTLVLTIEDDGKTRQAVVPESVDSGRNTLPTLVWDAESKTVFVVWMHMPNATSSELLVASYRDDQWQPAVSIDYKRALRYNLSVAITHSVRTQLRDDTIEIVPALVLHAAWWEEGGEAAGPRYAVMGLGGGTVGEPDLHELTNFVAPGDAPLVLDDKFNKDFLKHVAVLDGPTPDAVDVLFNDPKTNNFYKTTLRPIAQGRLHIPVGARPGGTPRLGGPKAFAADWSGRTSTITSPDGKTLIFCSTSEGRIEYVKFVDGKWSAAQHVTLSAKVSAESAMAALAKMAAATE
jgi:hypothetical protein